MLTQQLTHEREEYLYRRVLRDLEGQVIRVETTSTLQVWDEWIDELLYVPPGVTVELYSATLVWGTDLARMLTRVVERRTRESD